MQGLSCRYVHRFRELRAAAPSNFDIVIARTQVHFFVLLRASQTATVRESVPCEPLLLLKRRRPWEIAPQETSHDLSNQPVRLSVLASKIVIQAKEYWTVAHNSQ